MDKTYKFKQDDVVNFSLGHLYGKGKVCGIASEGVPILGVTYIVEVMELGLSKDEPVALNYTHAACFEANMQLAPRNK